MQSIGENTRLRGVKSGTVQLKTLMVQCQCLIHNPS